MTEQNETQNQPNSSSINEPPDWYKTPPPWFSNSGSNQNTPQHPPVQSRADILAAVNAMPDKIVDAIREAFPAPPDPPQQKQNNDQQQQSPAPEQQPGKRNSFAEWWFRG